MPERHIDDVIADMKKVEDGINVTISGGEPGMLSLESVKNIIALSVEKHLNLDLLTNGLFIEKYPNYLGYFDTIHYHCVESLKDDIRFPKLNSNYDYTIIVTEDEYPLLQDFVDKYSHITFSIMASRDVNPMTMKTKLSLIKNFKHRMTQRSISENLETSCETIGY